MVYAKLAFQLTEVQENNAELDLKINGQDVIPQVTRVVLQEIVQEACLFFQQAILCFAVSPGLPQFSDQSKIKE